MFIKSSVALQNDINKHRKEQHKFNTNSGSCNPVNPEDRRKEEMVLHLHMKNRKKYTHLYQLEKYFK